MSIPTKLAQMYRAAAKRLSEKLDKSKADKLLIDMLNTKSHECTNRLPKKK